MVGRKAPIGLAFALSIGLMAPPGETTAEEMPQTCSGEFLKLENGTGYSVGGCGLNQAIARRVMKFCSLGQQCEITGITQHCRNVRGACIELKRLISARWGKNLPICKASAAVDRANEWWSSNASVVVRGTIRENKNASPYGHMEIIMDLTTCSNGAPMTVVRVPEKWTGHYIEINGTAMKEGDVWYVIARAVKDVE
jgi:hypothetical protein